MKGCCSLAVFLPLLLVHAVRFNGDMNMNGIPDYVEPGGGMFGGAAAGGYTDFNRNGVPDQLEGGMYNPMMAAQTPGYTDFNRNGIPDQLEGGMYNPMMAGAVPGGMGMYNPMMGGAHPGGMGMGMYNPMMAGVGMGLVGQQQLMAQHEQMHDKADHAARSAQQHAQYEQEYAEQLPTNIVPSKLIYFTPRLPEVKEWFNRQVGRIPELSAKWEANGISLAARATCAYRVRHDAKLQMRKYVADAALYNRLKQYNLSRYGFKNGPSFEQVLATLGRQAPRASGDDVLQMVIKASATPERFEAGEDSRGSSSSSSYAKRMERAPRWLGMVPTEHSLPDLDPYFFECPHGSGPPPSFNLIAPRYRIPLM